MYPKTIKNLINEFSQFPGIGPKTAQRFVFYLLKKQKMELDELAKKIQTLKELKICNICKNFSDQEICPICQNVLRDHSCICLVANPIDLEVIEKTGEYKGVYHVLGGLINPAIKIRPDDLYIAHFLNRLADKKNKIKEVIFALNSNLEGETTLLYILDMIKKDKNISKDIKLTRLAKGLSSGMELEYVDSLTLSEALKDRRKL